MRALCRDAVAAAVLACLGAVLGASSVWAGTIEQIISREHALFETTGRRMAIGRDGKVYIIGSQYLLRIKRDGTDKMGIKIPRAPVIAAANADGVMAIAHKHMGYSLYVRDTSFQEIGRVRDFLTGNDWNWNAPSWVEVGTGGDFYVPDQNRNRIYRISAPHRIAETYSLKDSGLDFVNTQPRLRVAEPLKRFYIATLDENKIHAIGFDGKLLWTVIANVSNFGGPASNGEFDCDDEGNLYVLVEHTDRIDVFGPDGKPKDPIKLQMATRTGRYQAMRLWKDEILVKRIDPLELFQVYDRKTGAFKRAVMADAEHFRVEYPSEVWTAGQPLTMKLTLEVDGKASTPDWPVEIARYNDPRWKSLKIVDGKITPPADASGLYRMRIRRGEYKAEAVVEIRIPNSHGTVNVLTPLNRLYYGRGEEIPLSVLVRGKALEKLTLELRPDEDAPGAPLWTSDLSLSAGAGKVAMPATFTAALRPGRYLLTAAVPGYTVAPQPLVIGPGLRERPAFNVVVHCDDGVPRTEGDYMTAPEGVASHLQRTLRFGENFFMDYISRQWFAQEPGAQAVIERLKKDPAGVAPEKAEVESVSRQTIASYGAFGIEYLAILSGPDVVIPVGKGYHADPGPPDALAATIRHHTKEFLQYPAFKGWLWAQQWFIDFRHVSKEDRAKWNKARERSWDPKDSGKWDPDLDRISDEWIQIMPELANKLQAAMKEVAPDKVGVTVGPYRAVGVIPPISFRGTDEVDLFFQAEQVQPPQVAAHNVDFYKRPGKRAFGHPETGNDDGTGGQAYPMLLQMLMRGADGLGWAGKARGVGLVQNVIGQGVTDPRMAGWGGTSTFRAMTSIFRQYGPWLTTLQASDNVAIVVSTRMMRLEDWENPLGGRYFTRLFEAYNACLYAHRPATFVFSEDAKPDTLKQYKAVLVVNQTVEFDPPLAEALAAAQSAGVGIFYDGTCLESLVQQYKQLGVAFNQVEKDPHIFQDDAVYERMPHVFKADAAKLVEAIGAAAPAVAKVDNPEILLTERRSGEGRFVWVVNNDLADWEPGLMWRVGTLMANRVPQTAAVDLGAKGQTVYELFDMQEVKGDVVADLRTVPARLYAVLPRPIESISLSVPETVEPQKPFSWKVSVQGPKMSYPLHVRVLDQNGRVVEESYPTMSEGSFIAPLNAGKMLRLEVTELITGKRAERQLAVLGAKDAVAPASSATPALPRLPLSRLFGPHLRDIAVAADGSSALISAMNWDDNYYVLDTASGQVRQQGGLGHHYAYGPLAGGQTLYVQGYDMMTAQGYHLYALADGKPKHRFANFGVAGREPKRWGGPYLKNRTNSFAVSPKGTYVASGGNLGLVVWSADGKRLWTQEWWKDSRQQKVPMFLNEDTVLVLENVAVAAHRAKDGQQVWHLPLAGTGLVGHHAVSSDGKTIAVWADSEGGRVWIIRDGKVIKTLFIAADSMALAPDGNHLAVVMGNELRWYNVDGTIEWTFTGDDSLSLPQNPLYSLRIAPDGKRLAVASVLGSVWVLDDKGNKLIERDLGALASTAWLPDNDLLVATWAGEVMRLRADGSEKWRVRVAPKGPARLKDAPVADTLATSKVAWGNATAKPAALTPNLLTEGKDVFGAYDGTANSYVAMEGFQRLADGKTQPPDKPWMGWWYVNFSDSLWPGRLTLVVDLGRPVELTGVTFVEDPRHPQSWMRDAMLQYWVADKAAWVDAQYLLSDLQVHTHELAKPVQSSRFRLINKDSEGWPVGNLRLSEFVFHGKELPAAK